MNTYNVKAGKKTTSLTINADLLEKAKMYKINISQHLEHYLAEIVRQKEQEKWLQESQEAIDAFNERVEKQGTFSDGMRRF